MNTSVDFFNDILTVSSVILFAKFVTHRNRHGPFTSRTHIWHIISVAASALAIVVSLVGAELEADPPPPIHFIAVAAMAVGVVVLLVDVLSDDGDRAADYRSSR
jgi:hypothetical protein